MKCIKSIKPLSINKKLRGMTVFTILKIQGEHSAIL